MRQISSDTGSVDDIKESQLMTVRKPISGDQQNIPFSDLKSCDDYLRDKRVRLQEESERLADTACGEDVL